jgi:hypothetical protein
MLRGRYTAIPVSFIEKGTGAQCPPIPLHEYQPAHTLHTGGIKDKERPGGRRCPDDTRPTWFIPLAPTLDKVIDIVIGEHSPLFLGAPADVDVAKLAIANVTVHRLRRDAETFRSHFR